MARIENEERSPLVSASSDAAPPSRLEDEEKQGLMERRTSWSSKPFSPPKKEKRGKRLRRFVANEIRLVRITAANAFLEMRHQNR